MASSPAQSPKLHHIVAMPYPGCGHINPLLNLAGHLSTHGLLVTVVLTEEWLSFLSPPPSAVQFRSIPNVNPSEHGRANDLNGFLYAVNTKLEKPFECLLEVLDPPPPVILADTYLSLSVLERERERERERATMAEKVINKQVLFKDYVTGFPKEEDMVFTSSTIDLKLPQGSTAVLVKNLYLSCDPYMRPRMSRPLTQSYTNALVPGKSIGNTKLFV